MSDVVNFDGEDAGLTRATSPRSDKEYCTRCGKPLGGTETHCFECGGDSNRGGPRISNREWRVYLGV